MSDTAPIIIAGAGIAGLTAAIALSRVGFSCIIVERRARFEEVGAGLQLSPNASRVLIDLGLGGPIARRAVAPDRLAIRRVGEARAFAEMPMNQAAARFGGPFWSLMRADLQGVLLDAVRGKGAARLMVGRKVVAVKETADSVLVTVETEAGARETIAGRALIGADGIWSDVRRYRGDTSPPNYTGMEAWRATASVLDVPEFMRKPEVNIWLGPDRHVVHYPVAAGQRVNFVAVRRAKSPLQGWSNMRSAADFAPQLEGMAQPLAAALRGVPEWQVWSLHDRTQPRLAQGKVALIGDAAHPVLPFVAQGACLSIEDAVVVARELAAAPADIALAFSRYAADRQARAYRIQTEGRSNARRYHLGWPLSLARDFVMGRMGPDGLLQRYAWIYDWRV